MKNIQEAIIARKKKELEVKKQLEKADASFASFKANVMRGRKEMFDQKMEKFSMEKGEAFKDMILKDAASQLKIVLNKKEQEEQRKRRQEKDRMISEKN
mmetsp:Transcript_39824/g.38380  ORF Transcript_39824/g.38380 Transcript_39824/m.38380 type:complete len:99 (+) Transcript_39824:2178-2474(+)